MPLAPKLVYATPPFDFEGMRQRGEDAAIAAVADLSLSEVCAPRSTLIDRLRTRLDFRVPEIFLDKAAETVGDIEGFVCISIEAPFDDPSGIASLINSPALIPPMDFHVDVEGGQVSVHGYYGELSVDGRDQLWEALSEYKRNLDLAAEQIERFNAALPYILSVIIQDCMEGQSRLPRPDDELTREPPTKGNFHETLAELVQEGRIIKAQGINAKTGGSWTRYFAAGHAPEVK